MVTTTRIKTVWGLVKAATGTRDNETKTLELVRVDRIQKGLHSTRLLRATTSTTSVLENLNNDHHHRKIKNGSNLHPPELIQDILQEQKTLSIIYEAEGRFESLDLAIPDQDDYENVVHVLESLVSLHQNERRTKTRELQLLQHHWLELRRPMEPISLSFSETSGGSYSASLSQMEFVQLADRLVLLEYVGRQRISSMFKKQCEALKRKSEQLNFLETAALLEKVRNSQKLGPMDPLQKLWDEMHSTDPVPAISLDEDASYHSFELNVIDDDDDDVAEESISTVAFLSFLRTHQRESYSTLEQATELVNILNRLHSFRDNGHHSDRKLHDSPTRHTVAPADRLAKSRFMDYMISDHNDLLKEAPVMDMTRPLSHYFIATSHVTFLDIPVQQPGGSSWNMVRLQDSLLPDTADVESVYTALNRGVRCLEAIVWDGPNQIEPIVGLSQDDRKSIRFRNYLSAIAYFLDQQPAAYPILLKLENHCSTNVQALLAQQIRELLGLPGLLYEPQHGLQDPGFVLPSPEEARGKVIILGKRPAKDVEKKQGQAGQVIHDDYDSSNDEWKRTRTASEFQYFDEEEVRGGKQGVVVGFGSSGPIYSTEKHAIARTPQQIWEKAERERSAAEQEATIARRRAVELEERALIRQNEAIEMSERAGVSAEEFRHQSVSTLQESPPKDNIEEEKSTKHDEGVEIHEVVSDMVEASQQDYARATHEARESAKYVMERKRVLDEAEKSLHQARENVANSKVKRLVEESRNARLRATANREHADMANARLEHVRDLLKTSEETSSSAETVLLTALTEAKISEKRAVEAEARAARGFATAAKDRARSDDETQKEEALELRVTELLGRFKDAAKAAKASRGRLDKVESSLDRVTDQIKLIKNSTSYKNEMKNGAAKHKKAHGSTFGKKLTAKEAEREALNQTQKNADEEVKTAEQEKSKLQSTFEELNGLLRLQTQLSSKMRKVADRSARAAEELAEHAEEEREAANLRLVARERAEANVRNRGTQNESLQTQYQEAQRAASEAAALAQESRKHADQLEKKLEGAHDFSHIVEERERVRSEAQVQYDLAVKQRQDKDDVLLKQKKMFEISSEVRQSAKREIAQEQDRVKTIQYYHQEASVAYDQAARLHRDAEFAANLADVASKSAVEKARIARRALLFKKKMSLVVEIPPTLSAQTLLHSLRFFDWKKSLALSNARYHSIAFHVLNEIVESNPDEHAQNTRQFTQNHLCRIYPSRNDAKRTKTPNSDPTFPWSLGCQLVSMNYFSPDEHLLVAEGMFRRNNSCGYALKPPNLVGETKEEEPQNWSIEILGAYHLPRQSVAGNRRQNGSSVRPTVRLTIFSGEMEARPLTFETGQILKEGTDPVLFSPDDNTFTFDVGNPSISMASFTVWDQSAGEGRLNYVAGSAIPVSCFREGYRSIALFDAHHSRTGPYKFATLLVYASRED